MSGPLTKGTLSLAYLKSPCISFCWHTCHNVAAQAMSSACDSSCGVAGSTLHSWNASKKQTRVSRWRRLVVRPSASRKGVQSLRGRVPQLSPAQQLMCANLLLPEAPDDLQPPLQRQRSGEPGVLVALEDHPDTANSQDVPNPMAGVRFASMTGPGPSGIRPERIAAMLTCKLRRAVNRLMRAITEAQSRPAGDYHPRDVRGSWILGWCTSPKHREWSRPPYEWVRFGAG